MNQLELDFGVVAFTDYDEDGHLGFSADLPGEGAGAPPAEALSLYGFRSRPMDPDTDPQGLIGLGCGMLYVRNGDSRHAFALEDPRETELPKVRKGGAMFYCAAASFALFDGIDPAGATRPGSYLLSTSWGAGPAKRSHVLAFNVRTAGSEAIALRHGEGHGLELTGADDGHAARLGNSTGDAWIQTSDDGNDIVGKTSVHGSLSVGDAPTPASNAQAVAAALQALAAFVAAIPGANPGVVAAMQPLIAAIPFKFLQGT